MIPDSLHSGLVFAVVLAVVLYLVLSKTVFGYQIDAVGENIAAAEYGGISSARIIVLAMAVSGGLCGLAGGIEVSGVFSSWLTADTKSCCCLASSIWPRPKR